MTKLFCRLLALLALPLAAVAQPGGVTIGAATAPDASAALDVVSSTKGVLLPRVASTGDIGQPATGLIAYQTGSPAGYYYNAGTPAAPAWQLLLTADSPAFVRNGTALQPGSNFHISGDGTADGTLAAANARVTTALTGAGADLGPVVGLGIRADGGLNLGQNAPGNGLYLGYEAGAASTGSGNHFVGYQSGLSNTTGDHNHFNGYQSGYGNTIGENNEFSGYQSGFNNTEGNDNVFSGYQSGFSNTTGNENLFLGFHSGYYNTDGTHNLFLGTDSGYHNTLGLSNLFIGVGSGYFNTTGRYNLFSGTNSGYRNTTGSENQFLGDLSGGENTTGSYNVFSGSFSGNGNTTGDGNVFGGFNSGSSNITGDHNTALGYYSGPAVGSGALTNTVALGSQATVAASNTIQLGNVRITALRCQVGLTATSDARFKYDVQANVPGLAFITALRPVTYRFDQQRLTEFGRTGRLGPRSTPDAAEAVHTGFLAQDVERSARALGFQFDGVHAPANARDSYGLMYAQFVVPLVQAVQEQQAQIEELKRQNAALQNGAAADHASLLTLQAQMARLLGEDAQAHK
jgi:hypothetical protein